MEAAVLDNERVGVEVPVGKNRADGGQSLEAEGIADAIGHVAGVVDVDRQRVGVGIRIRRAKHASINPWVIRIPAGINRAHAYPSAVVVLLPVIRISGDGTPVLNRHRPATTAGTAGLADAGVSIHEHLRDVRVLGGVDARDLHAVRRGDLRVALHGVADGDAAGNPAVGDIAAGAARAAGAKQFIADVPDGPGVIDVARPGKVGGPQRPKRLDASFDRDGLGSGGARLFQRRGGGVAGRGRAIGPLAVGVVRAVIRRPALAVGAGDEGGVARVADQLGRDLVGLRVGGWAAVHRGKEPDGDGVVARAVHLCARVLRQLRIVPGERAVLAKRRVGGHLVGSCRREGPPENGGKTLPRSVGLLNIHVRAAGAAGNLRARDRGTVRRRAGDQGPVGVDIQVRVGPLLPVGNVDGHLPEDGAVAHPLVVHVGRLELTRAVTCRLGLRRGGVVGAVADLDLVRDGVAVVNIVVRVHRAEVLREQRAERGVRAVEDMESPASGLLLAVLAEVVPAVRVLFDGARDRARVDDDVGVGTVVVLARAAVHDELLAGVGGREHLAELVLELGVAGGVLECGDVGEALGKKLVDAQGAGVGPAILRIRTPQGKALCIVGVHKSRRLAVVESDGIRRVRGKGSSRQERGQGDVVVDAEVVLDARVELGPVIVAVVTACPRGELRGHASRQVFKGAAQRAFIGVRIRAQVRIAEAAEVDRDLARGLQRGERGRGVGRGLERNAVLRRARARVVAGQDGGDGQRDVAQALGRGAVAVRDGNRVGRGDKGRGRGLGTLEHAVEEHVYLGVLGGVGKANDLLAVGGVHYVVGNGLEDGRGAVLVPQRDPKGRGAALAVVVENGGRGVVGDLAPVDPDALVVVGLDREGAVVERVGAGGRLFARRRDGLGELGGDAVNAVGVADLGSANGRGVIGVRGRRGIRGHVEAELAAGNVGERHGRAALDGVAQRGRELVLAGDVHAVLDVGEDDVQLIAGVTRVVLGRVARRGLLGVDAARGLHAAGVEEGDRGLWVDERLAVPALGGGNELRREVHGVDRTLLDAVLAVVLDDLGHAEVDVEGRALVYRAAFAAVGGRLVLGVDLLVGVVGRHDLEVGVAQGGVHEGVAVRVLGDDVGERGRGRAVDGREGGFVTRGQRRGRGGGRERRGGDGDHGRCQHEAHDLAQVESTHCFSRLLRSPRARQIGTADAQ